MSEAPIVLGLRANWRQFSLLVVINAFVGAMVGMERAILPLIAKADFGIASHALILSFLISFGIVKALANLFAGRLSDRVGRRRILLTGWLFAVPVPLLIMFAPNWGWIIFANVLLGINQGLCWSTTVIMKIDLVGPARRGLAMGLNESAGYVAVALATLVTGYLAAVYGLRPIPFLPGLVIAILGLFLSLVFVRETKSFAQREAQIQESQFTRSKSQVVSQNSNAPSFAEIFLQTSWKDRTLFAASQAGMVNNLNDGVMWGLIPLYLATVGLPLEQVAMIAAMYPGVWGLSQLVTGALSDRWGRKWLIATGMWIQALGIVLFVIVRAFWLYALGALLLGIGTAMVYPTLIAAVSDVARPDWRASAVGVYRLWRDAGYAAGAVLAGIIADAFGIPLAIAAIAGITLLSGVMVAGVMSETLPALRESAVISLHSNYRDEKG